MRKKRNFKEIIIGTVIGIILCSIVGVCAVTYFPSNQTTYDNKTSGLNATNVQDAIDELYNQCGHLTELNNYFYYIEPQDGIFQMNLNSGKTSRIGKYAINPTSIFIKDNYIYYANSSGIYRMDIDGNNQVRLSTSKNVYHLYVTQQYIYYIYAYSNSYQYIHRMNLDGTSDTNIKELYGNYINSEIIVK